MATKTVKCKNCGSDISARAVVCPHCGASLTSKKKHVWKLIVAILFLISSPACLPSLASFLISLAIAAIFGLWWAKSCGYVGKAKQQSTVTQNNHARVASPAPAESPEPQNPSEKPDYVIPPQRGNAPLNKNTEIPHSSPIESTITTTRIDLTSVTVLRSFKDFVLLDTETTGLSKTKDRVIEVGITSRVNWEPSRSFSSLINPNYPISPEASAVNGLHNSDLIDAPIFEDIAPQIYELLHDNIVVGYNTAFDLDFLGREYSRVGLSDKINYVDVMSLAKRAIPNLKNYKLETVAKSLLLIPQYDNQRHRALDDANLTGEVLRKCIDILLSEHEQKLASDKAKRDAADAVRREKYAKSPLLDVTFAFTGNFNSGREYVESRLTDVGALLRSDVSSRLNYLVVGDISALPEWALQRKVGKADNFIAAGKNIKKISEAEYLQLIDNAINELAMKEKAEK